jgi:hypothetical protein
MSIPRDSYGLGNIHLVNCIVAVIRAPSSCPLPTTTTPSNDPVIDIKSALVVVGEVQKTVSPINMPHVILLTLQWQEMDS